MVVPCAWFLIGLALTPLAITMVRRIGPDSGIAKRLLAVTLWVAAVCYMLAGVGRAAYILWWPLA